MDENILSTLYKDAVGEPPQSIAILPVSGSSRRYYMIEGRYWLVGTIGTSREENEAFLYLSRHFADRGLPVPRVVAVSEDRMAYLQTVAGHTSLFDAISSGRETGIYSDAEKLLLKQAVELLARFQIEGARRLDWEQCYPVKEFSRRDVMWDLNYFKYCFLKPSGIEVDEARLEDEMETFAARLLDVPQEEWGFLHRDFQSRNILINARGEMSVIDFQGGRRGPVYYDFAALLWQARARVPADVKAEMTSHYFDMLSKYVTVDRESAGCHLRDYVLFRTLQVLGAYGFRGLIERKPHFIESIPAALDNVASLLPIDEYPYLSCLLGQIVDKNKKKGLTATVTSFSYKKGIPADDSGNGGGYVFDCRAIHNPGRYERYRTLTGMDAPVVEFLELDGEVLTFLEHAEALVDASVERYIKRGFTSLMVNFGCTGGQHRSVYCAQRMAEHLSEKYGIAVSLCHREQGITRKFPAR